MGLVGRRQEVTTYEIVDLCLTGAIVLLLLMGWNRDDY